MDKLGIRQPPHASANSNLTLICSCPVSETSQFLSALKISHNSSYYLSANTSN